MRFLFEHHRNHHFGLSIKRGPLFSKIFHFPLSAKTKALFLS